MKRNFVLLVMGILMFSVIGCGNKGEDASGSEEAETHVSSDNSGTTSAEGDHAVEGDSPAAGEASADHSADSSASAESHGDDHEAKNADENKTAH